MDETQAVARAELTPSEKDGAKRDPDNPFATASTKTVTYFLEKLIQV